MTAELDCDWLGYTHTHECIHTHTHTHTHTPHTHTHTLRALTLNVCVYRVYRADLYTRSRA